MSFEADVFQSDQIFQGSAGQRWTYPADLGRCMAYSVVPAQANQIVVITRVAIVSDNNLNPHAELDVQLGSINGTSPPGLIRFFATRIPAA